VAKLILFDIDGTLLHTAGAGRRAICTALTARLGVDGAFDRIRFDGKTDPQIVHELLEVAGRNSHLDDADVRGICEAYVEFLELELRNRNGDVRVYPGVEVLLDRLGDRDDAVVGLLTGNVVAGARLKLESAGLDPSRFRVGAFGSDAAERERLPAIAQDRAASLLGGRPQGDDVVIIGDTPADVTCGRSIGARAIGVATGSYTLGELAAAGAYAVFASMSETDAVEAAIFG
jgi:phosphoglycolate phosphatase